MGKYSVPCIEFCHREIVTRCTGVVAWDQTSDRSSGWFEIKIWFEVNIWLEIKSRIWSEITWFDFTWFEITWSEITWFDFTWSEITWSEITWFDFTWTENKSLIWFENKSRVWSENKSRIELISSRFRSRIRSRIAEYLTGSMNTDRWWADSPNGTERANLVYVNVQPHNYQRCAVEDRVLARFYQRI